MSKQKRDDIEDEFLSCPICFEVFKEPKTLSCLHRFCKDCLHKYLQRQKAAVLSRQGGFQCPVCRDTISSPDPSRPVSEWAGLFRTDFHLKSLITWVETSQSRRVPRPSQSCPAHGHAQVECDLYCTDCQLAICHLCAGISHRNCSKIITLSEAVAEKRLSAEKGLAQMRDLVKEATSLERVREKCFDYLEKQREAADAAITAAVRDLHAEITAREETMRKKLAADFEALHGKITVDVVRFENKFSLLKDKTQEISSKLEAMSDLDLLSDKSLANIAKLQEGSDKFNLKTYRNFLSKVEAITITLDKSKHAQVPPIGKICMRSNVEEEGPRTAPQATTSFTSVPTTTQPSQPAPEVKSFLARLRTTIGRRINEPQAVLTTAGTCVIKPTITNSQANSPNLKRVPSLRRAIMTTTSQVASPPRLAHPDSSSKPSVDTPRPLRRNTSTSVITRDENNAQTSQTGPSQNITRDIDDEHGALTFNNSVLDRQSHVPTAHHVAEGHVTSDRSNFEHTRDRQDQLPVNESDSQAEQPVKRFRSINTRFREDAEDPKLRDLAVIAGSGVVLVTDWANKCVKAIHVRRERDSRLAVGGRPWAITLVGDKLAAVSMPVSTQICVIKINVVLSVQNSFVSAKRYTGLASLSNTMLVASGGSDPPSVDIIDLYGEVLKTFSHDRQGAPLFQYPAYVCVTPAAMILVTDRKQGTVTCLTPTGDVKFVFHSEGRARLKEPSGVACDCTGVAIVAESRGLLTLTPTGQFKSILVGPLHGLVDDPRGVALGSGGGANGDTLIYVTSGDQTVEVLQLDAL